MGSKTKGGLDCGFGMVTYSGVITEANDKYPGYNIVTSLELYKGSMEAVLRYGRPTDETLLKSKILKIVELLGLTKERRDIKAPTNTFQKTNLRLIICKN